MIIILKRDDLPSEHRHRVVDSLELTHTGLSSELVEQADLIVFVEGTDIKFLKYFPKIQSKNSVDVLVGYITSTAPITKKPSPWSIPRLGQRGRKK